MDTGVQARAGIETQSSYAPALLDLESAPRGAPESLEDLITNVQALVRRVGSAVDPDLARLCTAVYADVDQVRARMARARHGGAPLWARGAVMALVAVAISLGVLWATRA